MFPCVLPILQGHFDVVAEGRATRQLDPVRPNFRVARDGETIYGNLITAAETRGGHDLTSRLGCRGAAMVLAAD